MNKKIFLIHFSIAIILLFPALFFNHKYNNINYEFNDEPTYKFALDITPSGEFNLHPVLIIYNFKSEEGNVTFRVSNGAKPSWFSITVPTELKVIAIDFTNRYGPKLTRGKDFIWEDKIYDVFSRVDLDQFNRSIDNYDVTIKFRGKLIPNAKFDVEFNVNKAQTQGGEFFNFIMGDYECPSIKDCLSSDLDRFNRYFYDKKDFKTLAVYRTDKEGGRVDPQYERFNLRLDPSRLLIDKKDDYNQWRFLFFGIILALIIDGLIVSIFSKENFLEENSEELKNLLKLKMNQLKQIIEKENLNVNDNDKLELAIKIIKTRKKSGRS